MASNVTPTKVNVYVMCTYKFTCRPDLCFLLHLFPQKKFFQVLNFHYRRVRIR